MRKSLLGVASGCVWAMVLLSGCGGPSGQTVDAAVPSGGLIGKPAPDFTVTAMNDQKQTIKLSALKGKVVILDFWGTFCEPCKKSFPKLQDLSTKYKVSGLEVVGISEDEPDDKDKIPSFAQSFGAKFPVCFDEDKKVAKLYDPKTMPSSFVIDRKGVVRFAHVGYHDGEEAELEKEVKQLLDEK